MARSIGQQGRRSCANWTRFAHNPAAAQPGKLPARHVFHAVGPVYRDGRHGEPELLASCYRKCLELAEENGVDTISFPAISTGIYGYPLDEAAAIALREITTHLNRPDAKVRHAIVILFGHAAYNAYAKALANLG